MEIRDWFILSFTFLVGIVAGVYFYATVFAPEYEKKNVFDDVVAVTSVPFDIIAISYGGFVSDSYEHPSFRLESDGSYRYTQGGEGQRDTEEGVLPEVLMRELASELNPSVLQNLSRLVEGKNCASHYDGIEYEYNVVYNSREYTLDTCLTSFDIESDLGKVLLKLWQYMDDPNTQTITISNTTDEAVTTGDFDVEKKKTKWIRMLNPVRYFKDGLEESFGTGE